MQFAAAHNNRRDTMKSKALAFLAATPLLMLAQLAQAVEDAAAKAASQTDIGPIALLFLVIIAGIGFAFWRMKRSIDKENDAKK
jgi:hypothetical protein